ncbi:hypothetical protein [Marinobacter salicampi]|uniref:hypothetical protein n=1 Tax=Marinobacter salicampi TaxID=435907 RepID=UPI001407EBFF|nr:hypothetical protein [Marinobacter salicampi]
MIRLLIVFVAISIFTPIALNTILPDSQKLALKHWLMANDMAFIAGVLLGEKEVPTAESPGDAIDAFTGLDYSENWDQLANSARKASESLLGQAATQTQDGFSETWTKQEANPQQPSQDYYPANDWFTDYEFTDGPKVNSVQSGGCVSGKSIGLNSTGC